MVSFTYGPIVSDARGSIRGTTFSRSLSGATGRGKPRPPRPQRSAQVTQQRALSTASKTWRTLALTLQADWNAYASTVTLLNRLGQTFNPSGQQMFTRRAVYGLIFDSTAAIDTAAPTATGLPTVPTFGWERDGIDLATTVVITPFVAGDIYTLSIYNWSYQPQAGYRILNRILPYTTDVGAGTTVIAGFFAAYTPTANKYWKILTRNVDADGRPSNPLTQLLVMHD